MTESGTTIGCPATDQRGVARPVNVTCDMGAYELEAAVPALLVMKAAFMLEDPVNGTTDPKAIPGAIERYLIEVTNTGPGTVDNDTLFISDPIPANMALRVIDYDGSSTWTYTPVDSGDGTDPAVTDIRINPKGIFASSGGGGDPSFQARFKAVVQYRCGHDSKWGRKSGRCCCFFRLG